LRFLSYVPSACNTSRFWLSFEEVGKPRKFFPKAGRTF
jgi:hypothetical protein